MLISSTTIPYGTSVPGIGPVPNQYLPFEPYQRTFMPLCPMAPVFQSLMRPAFISGRPRGTGNSGDAPVRSAGVVARPSEGGWYAVVADDGEAEAHRSWYLACDAPHGIRQQRSPYGTSVPVSGAVHQHQYLPFEPYQRTFIAALPYGAARCLFMRLAMVFFGNR